MEICTCAHRGYVSLSGEELAQQLSGWLMKSPINQAPARAVIAP